jgi:ribosome biogenesis GTPase
VTKHSRLDEDDVRIRPGRSKSRRRTKERPAFQDATSATVTTVDRGRFTLITPDGSQHYAVKARELGRKGIVVGDEVDVIGLSQATGLDRGNREDFARIVGRYPRTTTLRRTADDADPVERVIVANADQLAIVVASADPDPRPGLIDRAMVAAFDAGISPMLIITKTDIAPPIQLVELYGPLDIPIHEVHSKAVSADIRAAVADHATVLIGHSGVGKSTLVNSLVPTAERATGGVNAVTGKGRHTSTNVIALPLPGGGIIIDTPGIRSFGLAHVDADRVVHAFSDIEAAAEACPRGCSHDEPHCALDSDPTIVPERLASLRRLLRSRNQTDY